MLTRQYGSFDEEKVTQLVQFFIAAIRSVESKKQLKFVMDLLSLNYSSKADKTKIINDLRERLKAAYEPSGLDDSQVVDFIDLTVQAVENIKYEDLKHDNQ